MTTSRPERPEDVRVEEHIGLAMHIIKRGHYARAGADSGLDLNDFLQAAVMGMIRARETWDPALGSWGTYAGFWIRQSCRRLLANHGATVRIPVHKQEKRHRAGLPMRAQVFSLNIRTHNPQGIESLEMIDMLASPEPENEAGDLPDTTLEELIAATPTLTEREVRVLRLRARDLTGTEIGVELSLSRERIRQLELGAVVKIRAAQGLEIDDEIADRHRRLKHWGRAA